jgi:hypothetical protein
VGTVRGGFGNPWERLYLEEGVPTFVADNIKKCLWYSKIATVVLDPENEVFYDGHFMLKKLSDNISAPPVLAGLIRSVQAKNSAFGGSRYFEVLIDLYLINQATGKIIWQGIIANNTNHL